MNRRSLAIARAMNRKALEAYARLGITPDVVEVRDWGDLRRTQPGEVLLPRRFQAECGDWSGIKRHQRLGEPVCGACRAFKATQNRAGTGTRRAAA